MLAPDRDSQRPRSKSQKGRNQWTSPSPPSTKSTPNSAAAKSSSASSFRRADESHPEEPKYQLHSSLPDPVQQASHFLLGALTVLASTAEELEEYGDDKAEVFKRWQGVGEVLLNDMLTKAGEWEQEDT